VPRVQVLTQVKSFCKICGYFLPKVIFLSKREDVRGKREEGRGKKKEGRRMREGLI